MRRTLLTLHLSALLLAAGCSHESRSPDAIREQTANVTAGVARDAKALALGVVEGLRRTGPVNVNRASRADLLTLPGVDERTAAAIEAGRPYTSGADLLKRHLISRKEYNRISQKIVAR